MKRVPGFQYKIHFSDFDTTMDSDDADFKPGPSFKSVKFEPPIKKNRKKTTNEKSSFFKIKENKYLNKNNSVGKELVVNNYNRRGVPSKQVEEKEISKNDNDQLCVVAGRLNMCCSSPG